LSRSWWIVWIEKIRAETSVGKMGALFRARVSSFLAGVGVTTVAGMVRLKQDIEHSYGMVMDAMKEENAKLSDRVSALEASVGMAAASMTDE
jgi:hypothetical protein